MVSLPVINYYLHGGQDTMTRAHFSMSMAYGALAILMWVVAFYPAGVFNDVWLRRLRYAIIVYAIGFYMRGFLSLIPMMLKRFDLVAKNGYRANKGLETPWGDVGIWNLPEVQRFVWLRFPGDMIAAIAIAVSPVLLWTRLPKALKGS